MRYVALTLMVVCACADEPARTFPDQPDGAAEPDASDASDASDAGPDADAPAALELGQPVPAGRVIAGVATRADQLVAGPKAEGMVGDLVMANQRATFVIEGARRAGGYRMWGGHPIDVAIDGAADGYGEIWLAWNLEAFVPETASVISDGADGVAHVRLVGRTQRYPWPDSFLRALLNPPPAELAVTYDYRLRPDAPRLELTVTLDNDGAEAVALELPLVAMNMGDGARGFAPGGGFGVLQSSFGLGWVGAVGRQASYALASTAPLNGVFSYGGMDILELPAADIAAGEEAVFELAFIASTDGTPGIDRWVADSEANAVVSGTVAGTEAVDGAWVALTDGPRVGALAFVADGHFEARVPPGEWTVQAFAAGGAPSAGLRVTAPADAVALVLPAPAVLNVTIRDAASGEPIPAQLTLFDQDGDAESAVPPAVRIDRDWGGGRSAVIYAVEPATPARVPAGRYRAVASRGYSYELAEVALELTAGEAEVVDLSIERVVDTRGWAAADFHLHAQWSSDSDVSYDARVRQAAVNDVELPVLTEHAYVGDLLSAAELAGVADHVAAIAAQEVTTFEYGHFNAFPLVYDPGAVSGGAVFEHGRDGAELFTAMHAQQPGQVLVQVNHPRSQVALFAYFDYIGFDALTGIAQKPARASSDWELLEVFNGRCLGATQNHEALADWFALNDLGWKKTLSSGSDSHHEASGIGHPRSWVQVERAAVSLDPQAIVAPLVQRRSFVSCGPFVRFATADGVGLGGLGAVDADGAVSFAVTVEAPTWMQVDGVRFIENGLVIDSFEPAASDRGDDPARPALRFDGSFSASPARDAWYVIEVVGSGSLAPVEMGDAPYALTNPIDVDADGDGVWTSHAVGTP